VAAVILNLSSTTVFSQGSCSPGAITLPATVSGTLADGDCTAPHRSGSKADLYTFQGTASQQVTVTLRSTAFDAYLIVVGPTGAVLAQDDDSGGGSNAQIQGTLPTAGTYTIEATAYGSSERGAYTLTVASVPLCTSSAITLPATVNGTLADSDCTAPHRSGSKADLYTFQGTAGQQVTVTLSSTAFDAYLVIVGPTGAVLAEDDDSGGDYNARIQGTLPTAGIYTIEATAYYSSGRGNYTVAASVSTTSSCSASAITLPATVNGTLADSDCTAPHRSGSKADLYTFQGTAGQQVTVTLRSTAFDAYLIVVGPTGAVLAQDDDSGGGSNAQIQGTLPTAGTYTIEATAYYSSDRGSYTLTASASTTTTCSPGAITLPATVNGTLTDSDCTAPHRSGSKADVYTFQGTAGQTVTVTLSSTAFDAYLIVVGPTGAVLAENDDSAALETRRYRERCRQLEPTRLKPRRTTAAGAAATR
jgi:uncharacterized protein YdeI (BOF family)